MLFADALPTSSVSPENAVTIVIVFGVLMFVLQGLGILSSIYFQSRRKPALEAEFATKEEMAAGLARVDHDIKNAERRNEELTRQVFAKLDTMISSFNHELTALNRSIGKLEGHREMAHEIAEAIKKS